MTIYNRTVSKMEIVHKGVEMKSDVVRFIGIVLYFVISFSLGGCLLEYMEAKGIDTKGRSCKCCINHDRLIRSEEIIKDL